MVTCLLVVVFTEEVRVYFFINLEVLDSVVDMRCFVKVKKLVRVFYFVGFGD